MGRNHAQPTTPDLFPTVSTGAPSSPLVSHAAQAASSSRHFLPKDLPNAIKALTDQELDQLGAAVLVEQQRRGKKPPLNENEQKRRVHEVSVPVSTGKINAVRAAFKAGLKPSQIARQFGISHSDVRKALVGDGSKKASNSDELV